MKVVVRVSLLATMSTLPMARIESKDESVRIAMPLNAPLQARLAGRSKAYFWLEDNGHEIQIGDEAAGEDW